MYAAQGGHPYKVYPADLLQTLTETDMAIRISAASSIMLQPDKLTEGTKRALEQDQVSLVHLKAAIVELSKQ